MYYYLQVNLQSPGCLSKKGTVMHEMLHAAGFMHEQNRPDRDKYVIVNYNNIQSGENVMNILLSSLVVFIFIHFCCLSRVLQAGKITLKKLRVR